MLFVIAKIVHVIGNVLWLGGGAMAAFAFASLSREDAQVRAIAARTLRRLVLKLVTPGMLLSLAGGGTMLLSHWSELYARAPWMHMKLTVGLVAAGFSGVLSGRLRRAAQDGGDGSSGAVRASGGVLLFSAVAGVVLVLTRLGQ